MTTHTIRTESDLIALASTLLRFDPIDSLVVIGIGGGPTARIDLCEVDTMAANLAPALRHWDTVAVVTYGDTDGRYLDHLATILPGVTVAVTASAPNPTDPMTREEVALVAALAVDTVAEAEAAAIKAYMAGDGALAWIYYDRARVLNSERVTPLMSALGATLTNAVAPPKP